MAARDRKGPPPKNPGRAAHEQELEEAEGERQQKDGDQKRQSGEDVENVRERIRQSQPRQVR
jgi:hypothetical protein